MGDVLEALLFAVGEDGLTVDQLSNVLEKEKKFIIEEINKLKKKYESDQSGIELKVLGNCYKLVTKFKYKDYIKKLTDVVSNNLSKSALETLAIIAYNEPITRIAIDDIRGVNSQQMLRNLVFKGLIEDAGKSDLPGRPILYKTTNYFLDYFNLSSKENLPKLDLEDIEILEDDDLFLTRYKEEGE